MYKHLPGRHNQQAHAGPGNFTEYIQNKIDNELPYDAVLGEASIGDSDGVSWVDISFSKSPLVKLQIHESNISVNAEKRATTVDALCRATDYALALTNSLGTFGTKNKRHVTMHVDYQHHLPALVAKDYRVDMTTVDQMLQEYYRAKNFYSSNRVGLAEQFMQDFTNHIKLRMPHADLLVIANKGKEAIEESKKESYPFRAMSEVGTFALYKILKCLELSYSVPARLD